MVLAVAYLMGRLGGASFPRPARLEVFDGGFDLALAS
jgi:hypothetical protein